MSSFHEHDLVACIPSGKLWLDALVLTLAATHFLAVDEMTHAFNARTAFTNPEEKPSVKEAVGDALLMYRLAFAQTGQNA